MSERVCLPLTSVFAIAGQDVFSFGFGSLLYRISWVEAIYLAFEHILHISFSIGICFGGRNSEAPAIANTCSLCVTSDDCENKAVRFMKELFQNEETNIAAAPLLNEVSKILEGLELSDIMMPSNPSHEKDTIEQSKKDFFFEMANNTLEFVEFKLSLFELDLREIKKWVYREEMPVFYQLSDIVAICLCKVMGFELGRISNYVRNGDRSSDNELDSNKNSILNIKGFFNRIIRLERTEISETELKKLQREILFLNHKLSNTSFIKRLTNMFK